MALRTDWSADICPVARGLDVLGDPWVVMILRELFASPKRYGELHQRLEVSDKTLAARLKRMVAKGLILRVAPSRANDWSAVYELTSAGTATLPVLRAIADWADTCVPAPGGSNVSRWRTWLAEMAA